MRLIIIWVNQASDDAFWQDYHGFGSINLRPPEPRPFFKGCPPCFFFTEGACLVELISLGKKSAVVGEGGRWRGLNEGTPPPPLPPPHQECIDGGGGGGGFIKGAPPPSPHHIIENILHILQLGRRSRSASTSARVVVQPMTRAWAERVLNKETPQLPPPYQERRSGIRRSSIRKSSNTASSSASSPSNTAPSSSSSSSPPSAPNTASSNTASSSNTAPPLLLLLQH
jgi:hypothetical protein